MKFEWDESKYATNLSKHGIRFEDAKTIFADPHSLEMSVEENGEERFLRIGLNGFIGVLVVVYCERHEDTVRIISARKATKSEREQYEERI